MIFVKSIICTSATILFLERIVEFKTNLLYFKNHSEESSKEMKNLCDTVPTWSKILTLYSLLQIIRYQGSHVVQW